MSWHRFIGAVCYLDLYIQPGAARTEVAGLHGDRLKIRIAARAIDGAANDALIEFLAQRLGVARSDIVVASGGRSRRKRIAARGARIRPEALLA